MPHKQEPVSVSREIREEQKNALSTMTFKEKWKYFWYYYKVHVIAAALIIIVAVTMIRDIVTSKDINFYAFMLNSFNLNGEELAADFADFASLDTENYETFFDTISTLSFSEPSEYDMATTQKIMAMMQTQDLDVIVTNQEVFQNYAVNEMFLDLRTILTAEELDTYADYFFYVDAAEFDKEEDVSSYADMENPTAEELTAQAQAHKDPTTMEQPVPVGIYVSHSPFVSETICYGDMEAVYGVVATSARQDTAKQFLDYLFSGRVPAFTDPYFGSAG